MTGSKQELLQEAWLGGRVGTMSAQTQARAWALREAWKDEHGDKTYGMLTHIASKLYVISPPRAKKEHPSNAALCKFFQKVDSDANARPRRRSYAPPSSCCAVASPQVPSSRPVALLTHTGRRESRRS